MSKYRKRPIVIDATQFFPDKPWPAGVLRDDLYGPVIETREGTMHVSPGDWVITGVRGERYPCKPDVFELTYERED